MTKKPPRLRQGMTLGVVAPSSPVRERSTMHRGIARLEQLGFRLVLGSHVTKDYGYLAGTDAERAEDLLTMLQRDDVDGVICLGGGYGAARTARALDLGRLRQLADRPAKAFIGFSDITVLHAVLAHELGWTTFYGPMVSSFGSASEYTLAAFQRALSNDQPFEILPNPDDSYVATFVEGRASGQLVGGCLSLIVSLLGTPWDMDLDGKILFFEDVQEAPYRIDRMLTQLLAANKLQQCAGIVIGEHVDCAPNGPRNSLGLEQIFDDLIRPLGIPTIYNLPVGHGRHIATLPLGVHVELDATVRQLRVVESGVL